MAVVVGFFLDIGRKCYPGMREQETNEKGQTFLGVCTLLPNSILGANLAKLKKVVLNQDRLPAQMELSQPGQVSSQLMGLVTRGWEQRM